MTNLTREQRDNRDQIGARAAIERALRKGETAGIAVDDRPRMKKMLKRVKRIAKSMRIEFEVVHAENFIDVPMGEGRVRIFPVSELTKESK